jgi:hypothetical protein
MRHAKVFVPDQRLGNLLRGAVQISAQRAWGVSKAMFMPQVLSSATNAMLPVL